MKKKMNGLVKFLIICGIIAAAAAAVSAVFMKMKKKICPLKDKDDPEECDGNCADCSLCDDDDDDDDDKAEEAEAEAEAEEAEEVTAEADVAAEEAPAEDAQ